MPTARSGNRELGVYRKIEPLNFIQGVDMSNPVMTLPPKKATDANDVRMDYNRLVPGLGRTAHGSSLSGNVQLANKILKYAGTAINVVLTTSGLYKWSSNDWSSVTTSLNGSLDSPASETFGQNYWMFTNGNDHVKKYDGSSLTDLAGAGGYSSNSYHISEIIGYFGSRCILFNTTEDGNHVYQRVRWSNLGDIETWDATDFMDLVNTPGEIMGAAQMGNQIIIYKNSEIIRMRSVGSIRDFSFSTMGTGVGLLARGSLEKVGSSHFFLGSSWSQGINLYLNRGGELTPIGNPIRKQLEERVKREYIQRSWTLWNSEEEILMFFVPTEGSIPDTCWIYETIGGDLTKGRWWPDDIRATGGGILTRESYLSIGELEGNIEDQSWNLGQASIGNEGDLVAMGDDNGDVGVIDPSSSTDGDGNAIEQYVETKAFCYYDLEAPPESWVRSLGIEADLKGLVELKVSRDKGKTWRKVNDFSNDQMEKVELDFDISGRSLMFRFENLEPGKKFTLKRWLIKLQSCGARG